MEFHHKDTKVRRRIRIQESGFRIQDSGFRKVAGARCQVSERTTEVEMLRVIPSECEESAVTAPPGPPILGGARKALTPRLFPPILAGKGSPGSPLTPNPLRQAQGRLFPPILAGKGSRTTVNR